MDWLDWLDTTKSTLVSSSSVPGPPSNVTLAAFTIDSLTVKWDGPDAPVGFVKAYHVLVTLKKSFDSKVCRI